MTRILYTRHGETLWNIEKRMQGRKESPLSELGIDQAKKLSKALENEDIDIVISSSSNRAHNTAKIIVGDRAIPLVTCDEFLEMDMGAWEGMTVEEAEEKYPKQRRAFVKTPHLYQSVGGESISQLYDRVVCKLEELLETYKDKTVLIVGHTVVTKAISTYFDQRTLEEIWRGGKVTQACLNIVESDGNHHEIILRSDVSHLN